MKATLFLFGLAHGDNERCSHPRNIYVPHCLHIEYTTAWRYLANGLWIVCAHMLADEPWKFIFFHSLDFSPCFLLTFEEANFTCNAVFVTAKSHCWRSCRGHVAPLIHVEPPAASSPASRQLHQEAITNVKVHTIPCRLPALPQTTTGIIIAASRTQSLNPPFFCLGLTKQCYLERLQV